MKYTYTLFTTLLFPLFLSAQSHFMPGYTVNLQGDTIKGYIDYKEWDKNPEQIRFKTNDGKIEQYTATTINAFGVIGQEYYKSQQVSVSQNRVSVSSIDIVSDTTIVNRTVYLRKLTTGPNIILYKYSDNIKTRFYYAETGKKPQELIYKIDYNPDDDVHYHFNNRFRIQLQNIAQLFDVSTHELDALITNAAYNENSLVKIAQHINNNTNYVSNNSLGGVRGFVGLGVNFSTLSNEYERKANNAFPEIAFGIDLFLNKITQSVYFRLAVSATSNTFVINSNEPTTSPTIIDYRSSTIKQTFVSFNPQVVYNIYNTPNLKAFISLGIALHQSLASSYKYTDTYSNNTTQNFPTDISSSIHKFWTTLPTIKAGVAINKKIEVFAGYMPESDFGADRKERVATYQVGLNYFWGKKL